MEEQMIHLKCTLPSLTLPHFPPWLLGLILVSRVLAVHKVGSLCQSPRLSQCQYSHRGGCFRMMCCFCKRAIFSEKAFFYVAFSKIQPGNLKAHVVKPPPLEPAWSLPCADSPGITFKKLGHRIKAPFFQVGCSQFNMHYRWSQKSFLIWGCMKHSHPPAGTWASHRRAWINLKVQRKGLLLLPWCPRVCKKLPVSAHCKSVFPVPNSTSGIKWKLRRSMLDEWRAKHLWWSCT